MKIIERIKLILAESLHIKLALDKYLGKWINLISELGTRLAHASVLPMLREMERIQVGH